MQPRLLHVSKGLCAKLSSHKLNLARLFVRIPVRMEIDNVQPQKAETNSQLELGHACNDFFNVLQNWVLTAKA